jgi:hypothetical protein
MTADREPEDSQQGLRRAISPPRYIILSAP